MVSEATKTIENTDNSVDVDNIDDFVDVVFINDEPSNRVRKLCQKYYGDEWDNS